MEAAEEIPEVIATVEESEAEEIPELIATVEEIDAEVEEILEAIPSVEEETVDENSVDAIDIFWEERTHKTYRYDPDGNEVEQGDYYMEYML